MKGYNIIDDAQPTNFETNHVNENSHILMTEMSGIDVMKALTSLPNHSTDFLVMLKVIDVQLVKVMHREII